MQSTSRTMRVLLILLLWLVGGCASDRPPSGGVADTTPLQVLLSDPAPSTVNVSTKTIRLTFNHYVTARQLLKALNVTPSVGGYDITVDAKNTILSLDRPLQQNTTYILTLDKNLRDNRGQTLPAPYTMAFSTGAVIDSGTIKGKVINNDCSPATNALILAFAEHPESAESGKLLAREPDYLIQADPSGVFSFRHIAARSYRIIAINDRNNDLRYTMGEEEIGLSSMALVPAGSSDLLFRFSGRDRGAQSLPVSKAPAAAETGSISGTCVTSGKYVIIEASGSAGSYSTTATRDRKGTFHYSFDKLPPGSYIVSAHVPYGNKKPDPEQQWNPGSIEPFQPAQPFGFYPEKVTVRARWTTRNIDITIKTSR
jgi:hypothetical protein